MRSKRLCLSLWHQRRNSSDQPRPADVTVLTAAGCTSCNWCVAWRSHCVRNQTPFIQTAASLVTDNATSVGHSNTWAQIATVQAGRTEFKILVAARNISILQNIQVGFGAHPPSCGYLSSFLEAKRPERQADHLAPYSAQVQNEWSCPPLHFFMPCIGTILPLLNAV